MAKLPLGVKLEYVGFDEKGIHYDVIISKWLYWYWKFTAVWMALKYRFGIVDPVVQEWIDKGDLSHETLQKFLIFRR